MDILEIMLWEAIAILSAVMLIGSSWSQHSSRLPEKPAEEAKQ